MHASQVVAISPLCGLMGLLGQGVGAVVGLKGVTSSQGIRNQQSEFNAAYLFFSLMIGCLAEILAGLAIGLSSFQTIDLSNLKILLGVALAGYAGPDFIENTSSIIFPSPSKTAAVKPDIARDTNNQTLGAHVSTLNASVSFTHKGPRYDLRRSLHPYRRIPGLVLALNSANLGFLSAAFTKFVRSVDDL